VSCKACKATLVFLCADGIKPEDVGLRPDMPYFRTSATQRVPRITYLHIYECEKFSVFEYKRNFKRNFHGASE